MTATFERFNINEEHFTQSGANMQLFCQVRRVAGFVWARERMEQKKLCAFLCCLFELQGILGNIQSPLGSKSCNLATSDHVCPKWLMK